MSNFIKGEGLILHVYDGAAYRPIACLTSNSIAQTKNVIESQTKCNPNVIIKDPGSATYEISFEGQYIDTTSAGAQTTLASHDYLRSLFDGSTNVEWKMDTGLTDNVAYYGEGVFADLSLDAAAGDELTTFSGSVSGSGTYSTVDPN
tara:strand:- start:16 stop:456 length:441 start_codon:yes stop_codon:yes gene_type:complete